jgi:hypothetical protein
MRQEELREGIKRAFAITALMATLSLLIITEPAHASDCCGCCFDNCGNFEFVPAGQTTEHYWTIGFSYSDQCGRWNVWYRWEHTCNKYDQYTICQRECYCCVTKKWEATGSPTRHLVQQISMCSSPWIIEIRTLPDGEIPPLCEDGDCPCGSICDDGNPCTDDSCSNGECISTPNPANCDDGDACTTDYCDPATGCTHGPVSCDDGDPCTTDACVDGQCTSTPKDCNDNDRCTDDACVDGKCTHTLRNYCKACVGDNDCSIGQCCNGLCTTKLCDGAACNAGTDCAGEFCCDGVCSRYPCPIGTTCSQGSDCDGGNCCNGICSLGLCDGEYCFNGGECNGGVCCHNQCTSVTCGTNGAPCWNSEDCTDGGNCCNTYYDSQGNFHSGTCQSSCS